MTPFQIQTDYGRLSAGVFVRGGSNYVNCTSLLSPRCAAPSHSRPSECQGVASFWGLCPIQFNAQRVGHGGQVLVTAPTQVHEYKILRRQRGGQTRRLKYRMR